MPNQERADNPGRRFRCHDDDWLPFQELTAANGTTPSEVLRECVKGYNAEHGAHLSPSPDLAEALEVCPISGGGENHTWHDDGVTHWRCDCGVKGIAGSPAAAARAHLVHLVGSEAAARIGRPTRRPARSRA